MKRALCILIVLLIALPLPCLASENIDISSMTFDELISLRDKITKEITSRPEWKDVTVPAGVYEIGTDIPAGHWTISYNGNILAMVTYGKSLNASKTDIDDWDVLQMLNPENKSMSIELKAGYHIVIQGASVSFTPYIRPSLGF